MERAAGKNDEYLTSPVWDGDESRGKEDKIFLGYFLSTPQNVQRRLSTYGRTCTGNSMIRMVTKVSRAITVRCLLGRHELWTGHAFEVHYRPIGVERREDGSARKSSGKRGAVGRCDPVRIRRENDLEKVHDYRSCTRPGKLWMLLGELHIIFIIILLLF